MEFERMDPAKQFCDYAFSRAHISASLIFNSTNRTEAANAYKIAINEFGKQNLNNYDREWVSIYKNNASLLTSFTDDEILARAIRFADDRYRFYLTPLRDLQGDDYAQSFWALIHAFKDNKNESLDRFADLLYYYYHGRPEINNSRETARIIALDIYSYIHRCCMQEYTMKFYQIYYLNQDRLRNDYLANLWRNPYQY